MKSMIDEKTLQERGWTRVATEEGIYYVVWQQEKDVPYYYRKVIINKKEFILELVPFTTLIGRNWTLHIKTDNYPVGSLPVGTFEQIDKVVELLNEE